jgi:hypothetical protein
MKRIIAICLLLLLVLISVNTFAQGPLLFEGDCYEGSSATLNENGLLHVVCYDEAQEPTPIPPTPTPTPAPGPIAPYPSAPSCNEHDPLAYHGLWNGDSGCHYDHTHGDNPHSVDDVFGTALFDMMGGEISYPWHTPGENEEIKHRSYQWLVERDLPCVSQYTDGCITDYRAFVHNDLHNVFSTHHSALVEARVCRESDPTDCGYFLVSGHQATGDLIIDGVVVLDREEPSGAPRPVMLHHDTVGNVNFATWYPVFSSWMRVSTEIGDMWGYYPMPDIVPTTPDNLLFTLLTGNASRVQPHVIGLGFSNRNLLSIGVDPSVTNVNFNGFLNVHTATPDDCVIISETCAPLILNNVPNVQYQHRGGYRPDFDICFNDNDVAQCLNNGSNSSGWLIFPGFAQ